MNLFSAWAFLVTTLPVFGQEAALKPLAVSYRPDESFPQFTPFWTESWNLKDPSGETARYATLRMPLGGSLHLYLKNAGTRGLSVEDVLLENVSLSRAVAFQPGNKDHSLRPASVRYARLPETDARRLRRAGTPIWWRVDPEWLPPGDVAEAAIRLRRPPREPTVKVGVRVGNTIVQVPVSCSAPKARLERVSFDPGRRRVYLYARRLGSRGGARIRRVRLDGNDVSARMAVGDDPRSPVSPVVLSLPAPLSVSSYHCYAVEYDDGVVATGGRRTFAGEFIYGMWGSRPGKEGDRRTARDYVRDLYAHNINVQMEMVGSAAVREFLKTEEGQALCVRLGIRRLVNNPGKGGTKTPWAFFVKDEPDCGDFRVTDLPLTERIGSLAQSLVHRCSRLRDADSAVPQLLNVDLTFKPENWYVYGQLPDILAADPYYQERIRSAYFDHPGRLPLYSKALYVYAVARVCQSACSPKPLHLILNSVHHKEPKRLFRYATPEEKRIEVFYALAAGATGLSYWWYTPVKPFLGVGAADPQARALWREIGLLGAEVRTVGPVLTRSCPAPFPVSATRRLWVRTLLAGTNTLVLLCVNDDYASDRAGTAVRPLERASLTLTPPKWLTPTDVFSVGFQGVEPLEWRHQGGAIRLSLGSVRLTRLVVVTSVPGLRAQLSDRFQQTFADRVEALTRAGPPAAGP